MEPRAAHAAYDRPERPHHAHLRDPDAAPDATAIADMIGIPETDCGSIAPDVGGGFGQKMSTDGIFSSRLARKLAAPQSPGRRTGRKLPPLHSAIIHHA